MSSLLALVAALAGCATQAGEAQAGPAPDSPLQYAFGDVQRFTDFRDDGRSEVVTQRRFAYELNRFAGRERLDERLGDARLEVTFLDIDLAGDPRPHLARGDDIRVMQAIFPPRMTIQWRLVDAAGAVLGQGEERLTDPHFLFGPEPISSSRFVYDLELIEEWMDRAIFPLVES